MLSRAHYWWSVSSSEISSSFQSFASSEDTAASNTIALFCYKCITQASRSCPRQQNASLTWKSLQEETNVALSSKQNSCCLLFSWKFSSSETIIPSFSPGFHARRGSQTAALFCGCDAHFWISLMWDHLLQQDGAADAKTWTETLTKASLQPLTRIWASSPSVSLCSSFWRSSWGAPWWPPPQDRAVGVPEPSEDTSPPAWPGWTHSDHYSPTGKSSHEETCFYLTTTHRHFNRQQLQQSKVYLVDLLELRPDVLLLPQTLTEAPVRRGKEKFVWMWNAERGRHR